MPAVLSLNFVENPPLIPSLQLALWSLYFWKTHKKECKKSFSFFVPTQIVYRASDVSLK